jgi:predicted enzyme related to lactoylglutathione lyase
MKILELCFRVYATADALDTTIAFYEQLQGTTCARRVTIAETGVVAARVGQFLILAGDGEVMTAARRVDGIFYVDDLDAYAGWVRDQGGELLHEPRIVTSGRNFTARHPDGLVMEYFEAASSGDIRT